MEEQELTTKSDTIEKIDILSFLSVIMKYFRATWWILALLILLGGALGFLRTERGYSAIYEASASFAVSSSSEQTSIITRDYYNKLSTEQLNATFPYILTSGVLNQIICQDLGLDSLPASISAQMIGETNLFQIKVVSQDPEMAHAILQSVIENYPTVARHVIGNTKLKLLDESGIPTTPMNQKNPGADVIEGILKAILIYLMFLFVLTMTRHTIKKPNDLKKHMALNCLAGVPQIQFKRRSLKNKPEILITNSLVPDIFSESIETLEVRLLRAAKEKEVNSILITSATPGEGKTTIACNLALMMAKKGYRTLLLDCDLRNPSIAAQLSIKPSKGGMCDVLRGKAKVDDVIIKYSDTLFVLPGGNPVSDVSNMYAKKEFEKLLTAYKDFVDIILIDTPPCAFMHDTALVARYADLGLMVIRQDYAHTNRVLTAIENLSHTGLDLVGYVINGESTGIGSYGYGKYGYGRYGYSGRYGHYGYYGKQDKKDKKTE